MVSPIGNGTYYPPSSQQGYPSNGAAAAATTTSNNNPNNYGVAQSSQNYSYDPEIMNKPGGIGYVPPGDEFVKPPEAGTNGPYSVMCNFCSSLSKTKSDFYCHLAEKHFKNELMRELPTNPPYLCTLCNYESKDRTLNPLIRHYGVAHKMVQKYIQGQMVGCFVASERNIGGVNCSGSSSETSSTVIKCPFCELGFATKYAFHQHLCDQHFKDRLSTNLPNVPPFKCPVNGCTYISKDSRHFLIRHYGMTHRFVIEILKTHLPDYVDEDEYSSYQRQYSQLPQRHVELQPRQMSVQQQQQQSQTNQKNITPSQQQMDIQSHKQHQTPHSQSELIPTQNQNSQRADAVVHQSVRMQQDQRQVTQQVLIQPSETQVQAIEGRSAEDLLLHQQQLPSISEFFQNAAAAAAGVNEFPPSNRSYDSNAQGMHLEPQIDGTFDHITDPSTNLILDNHQIKEESAIADPGSLSTPHPMTSSPVKGVVQRQLLPLTPVKGTANGSGSSMSKTCELCFKTFEGKNKSMLKIQHLVFHFKDKLYANLKETSPPFSCPEEGCSYTSKHKPDWARHYGSVHKYIEKYLKEKLEENMHGLPTPPKVPRGEECLMNKNYSNPMPGEGYVQCFMCEDAPWFKNEDHLDKHFNANHRDFMREFNSSGSEGSKNTSFEALTMDEMMDEGATTSNIQPHMPLQHQQPPSLQQHQKPAISTAPKNCGRPCEICGYEPKTKNKSRERQDHLAMKHYKDRIVADLSKIEQFHCPLCDYIGKDKQTIHRHYTGKHKVVEKYLAEDLASRKVIQFQNATRNNISQVDGSSDIPQFDGAGDVPMLAVKDEIEDEEDVDVDDDEEEIVDEEEEEIEVPPEDELENNSSSLSSAITSNDKVCTLCQEPLRTNRHYHYAYKHFRHRLTDTLPKIKPFRCPICDYEAKHKLNIWMHYLSRHNYGDLWTEMTLSGELEREIIEDVPPRTRTIFGVISAKMVLREEVPYYCPLCHFEGKSYSNLCVHFLSKHGFLENWVRDAFEEMTEKIGVIEEEELFLSNGLKITKEELDESFFSKTGLSSIEELSTDDEEEEEEEGLKTVNENISLSLKHALDQINSSRKESTIGARTRKREKTEKVGYIEQVVQRYKLRHPTVDHFWICNGNLLVLNDSKNPGNINLFKEQWVRGQPVIVANVDDYLDKDLWTPAAFKRDFGSDFHDIVNTRSGKTIPHFLLEDFWDGFENLSSRRVDEQGNPMLLKLKDWPTDRDICHSLPKRFADLMNHIPLPDYTLRPDLGPKMYIAYGNALYEGTGTTNLHIDMSDACNVLVYVGLPKDGNEDEHYKMGLKQVDASGCDLLTRNRVRDTKKSIGAIWHIYDPKDADKIRSMLNAVKLERGLRLTHNSDPIHDQSMYLDQELRERLYKEYGVVGYAFPQCAGDTVFIPAGAPHQVRNIHNCIKIAEDFVTPENLNWCFYITEEFRHLSETHTNHEDKLQIKNMLYHSVKDCVSVLEDFEIQNNNSTSLSTEAGEVLSFPPNTETNLQTASSFHTSTTTTTLIGSLSPSSTTIAPVSCKNEVKVELTPVASDNSEEEQEEENITIKNELEDEGTDDAS
ncbi:KDM3 [Lepeophtheirus salmonis]|uniref:KDM3 n=1 Tax=Lepeophtheirus salmonis TaxID=72036 RepID=A0A7R8D2W5_LEPSM|nr:KDM3 [Lepeophtheirus salmonis]CAF3009766.1 KDM3 [Lepeophtheirus salmonis]